MHTIQLKNFDILVKDPANIIPLQSGKSVGSSLDEKMTAEFAYKLDSFLLQLDNTVKIKPNSKILDIGAGNSLFDIALAKHYSDLNLNFVLVDGDNYDFVTKINVKYIHDKKYQPYNVWSFVFDNIRLNGLDVSKFQNVDLNTDTWGDPNSFDIIMSTSSWGWHYPIETYLEKSVELLKPGGYLIIRPLLNVHSSLKKVNSLFGEPVFFKSFTFERVQKLKNVKSYEEERWSNIFKSAGPNDIMFYHAIWQKPQSE